MTTGKLVNQHDTGCEYLVTKVSLEHNKITCTDPDTEGEFEMYCPSSTPKMREHFSRLGYRWLPDKDDAGN